MAIVDANDWKILRAISHNARMPTSAIARRTGIKRETVKYRLKKLVENGVIKYFLPFPDFAKLGYPVWGMMLISFKDLDKRKEKQFDEYVARNPNVLFAYKAIGEFDYGIEFFAKTPKHLHEIQQELKRRFSTIIKDVKTGLTIEATKLNYVPQESLPPSPASTSHALQAGAPPE